MIAPLFLTLAALASPVQDPPVWDARTAEHLLNRAGFGAAPAVIAEAVAAGREATIERLLAGAAGPGRPLIAPRPELRPGLFAPGAGDADDPLAPGEVEVAWPEYVSELGAYVQAWIASMVAGDDPLRDRMALFWHNHFVSSFNDVGDARKMVMQASFLRANALGRFEVLVRGIARDPAMLEYLNNNLNVKEHPNENWARELMELFALGEGNYTEDDIKEAARAFTGWGDADHRFRFDPLRHDYGSKTVLGVTGNLDGDQVIDVLLGREACAEWLASKLLVELEGEAPDPARLADYAAFLREHDYDVAAFLRRLFQDDAFYREEILGVRVASPIEYLVGATRRLGADVPPQMIFAGADLLGQRLLYPPSVKGWEGGLAWLTTGSVLNRSNVAGALLGDVELLWLKLGGGDGAPGAALPPVKQIRMSQNDPMRMLGAIQENAWRPELDLAAGLTGDDEADARALLDRLLARPVDAELVDQVAGELARERASAGLAPEAGYRSPEGERVLRNVAHAILGLPEAMTT